jgi:hypothetical protein
MAGLLDIFGTGGVETMGLLGMSPEDIQKNRSDAQAQALYALAGRLFQGGRGGASIVEGLQQGQQAYKTAMQGNLQQQLQNAQVQELLRKRQQEQAALAEQQRIQNVLKGGVTQPQEIYGEDIMGQRVGEGMTAGGFDLQRVMPQLMTSPEGRKALKDFQPEYKEVNGALYEITLGAPPKLVAGSKKRDTVTVGNVVLDKDNMSVLYTAPNATAASIQEFQDFMKLPPTEQQAYLNLQSQKRPSTTINMPSEGERKSAVLANRMNFGVMQMNEAIGKTPTAAMPNTAAEAAKFFTNSDFLSNKLTPESRQVVETAQLDVLDAALTLGTGAAYTREQLEGYRKSYFPQLGDKPETVRMKQKRLENLLRSAEIASGRSASSVPTKMPQAFEMPSLDSILGPR